MTDKENKEILSMIFNILIVLLVIVGTIAMLTNKDTTTGLTAAGFQNLKFFTVLSNEFCAIVAVLFLICRKKIKKNTLMLLKLMAAAATGVTFLIIAAFLQPLYPDMNLYRAGNFFFHLIVPLVAMTEFIFIGTDEKLPFYCTFISAIPAFLYGSGYIINILINGKGEWPDTNDWYGFLNWGWPVGIAIFLFVIVLDWAVACLLRLLNKLVGRKR